MTTLQEYLDNKYPTKEEKEKVKEISIDLINEERKKQGLYEQLEGGELDLQEFKNVEIVYLSALHLKTPITELDTSNCINLTELTCSSFTLLPVVSRMISLNLSGCANLTILICNDNDLTSVDFLNPLPNPEKLEHLSVYDNNIEPTDIEIFSRFINLKTLQLGTTKDSLREGKNNKFYGSLKSYRNLTKLGKICIEATDVNEGLEYLPSSLVEAIKERKEYERNYENYYYIECSSHDTNAKCKTIQDQLRPYNYDLEAWQLANTELMAISRPELFTSSDKKDVWLTILDCKIGEAERELLLAETNESKRIERLKQKKENLTEVFTPSVVRTAERVEEIKTEIREKYKQLEQQRKTNQSVYSSSNSLYGYEGIGLEENYGTVSRIKDEIEELKEKLEQLELQNQIEQKPK